ncbi:MAG: alpha/beta fold hydrolase [Actinomycetota bacterium]|nr:alpha/beta hydrolase [Actinomycetota bacterium]
MPHARRRSLDIYYEDLGGPEERTVLFLHGLLLSFEMMKPIAEGFHGSFRPVLVELHGHGRSSRPKDPSAYSMMEFAQDVVAVADELGVERIGIFGTSLGADVALEAMLDYPERIAGAVLEMPVLEQGAKVASRMFKPFARALRSRHAPRALKIASRRIPNIKAFPGFADAAAHLATEPAAGAAVIEGLLAEAERDRWSDVERCQIPALVIAHALDPLHAFADAQHIAKRLPRGELVRAYSILELRIRPKRLVAVAGRFLEQAFAEAEQPVKKRRRGATQR